MNLQELKIKKPPELLAFAEEQGVEGAAMMRRQELMFAILQKLAAAEQAIFGTGTIEVLPDGFGYLRSMEANYLPGADDIYVSPTQVRKFGLRTGDMVEGEIRAPKDGERYFAMVQINKINFDDPESLRHRIGFDSLTPLYPDQKLSSRTVEGDTGQYAAWAWGASRVIDGLQLIKDKFPGDLAHITVTGCSRAGKLALFAGAKAAVDPVGVMNPGVLLG